MGITISHKIGIADKKNVIKTLNNAEKLAEWYKMEGEKLSVPVIIKRHSDTKLFIDIGRCQTLAFDFKTVTEIKAEEAKDGYSYAFIVLKDNGRILKAGYKIDEYPQNEIYYSADFCKTQF